MLIQARHLPTTQQGPNYLLLEVFYPQQIPLNDILQDLKITLVTSNGLNKLIQLKL